MDVFDKCIKICEHTQGLMANNHYFFSERSRAPGLEVMIGGRRLIMIGSNNYLGLTNHPRVKEAAIRAIEKFGSGCAGSRFLNGNLEIHEELEKKLATFFRKEAALVFATGLSDQPGNDLSPSEPE